jgi:L-lactate dehydrogenase
MQCFLLNKLENNQFFIKMAQEYICLPHSIAVIGVGQVGGAAASALVLSSSFASHLLLVDVDTEKRDSQVRDLSDAACISNSSISVRAATYREASSSDIIIITAGSKLTIGKLAIKGIPS